jgi:parvulin-like peptidyl-prolyl isomerase
MRFVCLLLVAATFLARGDVINGINAIVENSIITYQEVEESLEGTRELLRSQFAGQPQVAAQKLQEARAEAMDELVKRQLILKDFEKQAKEHNFKFPEALVDDAIADKIKRRYGDRATLMKTLQARGMSYETFRQQQKDLFIVQGLTVQKVAPEKILISPHKIEVYYEGHQGDFKLDDQVKLRMISLNKAPGSDGAAARKLASEILAKIEAGTPFAEMASVYSDGPLRAQGGDRGWVDRTYFKKEITDAAFSLKPGQHSNVLDLPEACYLLLVEEARVAHIRPLPDVKEEIEKNLKADERNRLEKKWIDRLRQKAFIRYF